MSSGPQGPFLLMHPSPGLSRTADEGAGTGRVPLTTRRPGAHERGTDTTPQEGRRIMSKQVVLEFPVELPDEGLCDPDVLGKGKTAIVLEMLRKGTVSQGRAAELLEVDRNTLFDLMAAHGVPGITMTSEELQDELSRPLGRIGTGG